ncbi:hypothetical protein XENTR_v10017162 [Xenopus tropicalis]|nr:hypothetical protein XENTR_v10017162 [Xenopus tropicalis]
MYSLSARAAFYTSISEKCTKSRICCSAAKGNAEIVVQQHLFANQMTNIFPKLIEMMSEIYCQILVKYWGDNLIYRKYRWQIIHN